MYSGSGCITRFGTKMESHAKRLAHEKPSGMSLISIALSMMLLVSPLCTMQLAAQSKSTIDPSYVDSYEKWKAGLVSDLKENWLTLAGLFWLKDGPNPFGTDASNAIVLPKRSAPPRAGTFVKQGEEVSVRLEPGVKATIDGKPVATGRMQSDMSGNPSVLELARLRMLVIKRGLRTGIRLKDLDNSALRSFHSLEFYPLNPDYRVSATWIPAEGSKFINVANILGDIERVPIPGQVRFMIQGKEVQLTATGGSAAEGLFFVFADATTKTETYPGGRFLDTGPVSNGTVVLDFNEAYNPPCAVTPYATCPLPPKENRLSVPLRVGEKYDHNHAAR